MSLVESSLKAVTAASNKAGIDLFELLGTDGCKLDCAYWQTWLDVNDAKKNKRKMRQEKRELKKVSSPLASRWEKDGRRSISLDEILESAASGCGTCGVFGRLLGRLLLEDDDLVRENIVFRWTGYHFRLQVLDVKNDNRSLEYQFFNPTGTPNPISNMPSTNTLSGDTSDAASLQTARSWIEHCDASHGACRTQKDPELPKRVLDLAEIVNEGKVGIRLIEDSEIVAPYACLSHCWGTEPMPVRTLKKTRTKFLEFIDWANLPRTFQDAIIISRELGLRYLWIDSLCIIQDSPEDWQTESGKMADVYRNGYITIAAVSSPDFRHGCFPKIPRKDVHVEVKVKDGIIATVVARQQFQGSFEQQCPLFTRAWVYQERMLSRRVLLCDHRELQLECRTTFVCQCGNKNTPPHMRLANPAQVYAKHTYSKTSDSSRFGRNWHHALQAYSQLRLTHGSDKLPALSACASDFSAGRGRYLAGAWEQSLVEDLLWVVDLPKQSPHKRRGRPVWRAPSWSWASSDEETGVKFEGKTVNFSLPTTDPSIKAFRARILKVECTLKPPGLNRFGGLAHGYMQLRTPLVLASLRNLCHFCLMGTRNGRRYLLETNRIQELQNNHARHDLCILEKQIRFQIPQGATMSFNPDFMYEDRTFDFAGLRLHDDDLDGYVCRQVAIWLMYICDMTTQQPTGERTMYFMVLKHLPLDLINFNEECYERVGMMKLAFPTAEAMVNWKCTHLPQMLTEEKVITLE